MNILIPNSWLKDYLNTNATPQQFAEAMSLTSVSIEQINEVDGDFIYDIEVTTNRPDLMSIEGIAREASAVLPQAGYQADFHSYTPKIGLPISSRSDLITIENEPELVNRITAIVMEIVIKPSPKEISERLERTDIRSINNVIDVTNYIMRELGHPVHAFDYDRLSTRKLIIRKSKPGEKITTLDGKEYELPGNDIVADDGSGNLVDLLGIMGLENSSITDSTKRVLLFIDNNNPQLLRKTSMNLGIRTEAAILNEKGIDPEKMIPTILRGVELLQKIADAKVVSDLIDIYPNKPSNKAVSLTFEKINSVIGIEIEHNVIIEILENLGFGTQITKELLTVSVPTDRSNDIEIPEDIIEEVARVYGYHKIPNILPVSVSQQYYHQDKNEFYWIKKVKSAFLYWGFNEVYTYSMVGESLFDGPTTDAVRLKNPLDQEHEYLRNSLLTSLIAVADSNKSSENIKIFELSNVYLKKANDLPNEILHLAAFMRDGAISFFDAKGIVEQILNIFGINDYSFEQKTDGIEGAIVKVNNEIIGNIEYDLNVAYFELDFSKLLLHCSNIKKYIEPPKYPPIIEDIRIEVDQKRNFLEIKELILSQSNLIQSVDLLDIYGSKRTFRIIFLDRSKSLTNEDIIPIRNSIFDKLKKELGAIIG